MAVDTSFPAMVNAAGGLLFLLAGVGILALSRGARRGRILAWFSIVFGAHYVVNNLYFYAGDDAFAAGLGIALALGTMALALVLGRELLRGAPPRARRTALAMALLVGAVYVARNVASIVVVVTRPDLVVALGGDPTDLLGHVYGTSLQAGDVGLLALLAAGVAHVRTLPPAARERRAAIHLTLAFGLYIVLFVTAYALQPLPPSLPGADLVNVLTLLTGFVAVACFAPLIGATPEEPRLARRAVLAFVAAGLAGCFLAWSVSIYGETFAVAFGISRTIGVVLLAIAVLRYDLLGVPLPAVVHKRGALATAALASLLIVAQVAQNFVSPQFSLIVGGVASGALIFATERRRMDPDPARSDAPADTAALAYRAAVRAALEDGIMTTREEEHLAEVAHHLRLSPLDALRMRREVERELGR